MCVNTYVWDIYVSNLCVFVYMCTCTHMLYVCLTHYSFVLKT